MLLLNAPLDAPDAKQDPLRYVSSEFRVLAALIDAIVSPWDWRDWRVIAQVETAMIRELPPADRPGWNRSKSDKLMASRGWATVADVYDSAGIKDRHRTAMDKALAGWTDREIAAHLDVPPTTIRVWLHRTRERLRQLDLGDLAEVA